MQTQAFQLETRSEAELTDSHASLVRGMGLLDSQETLVVFVGMTPKLERDAKHAFRRRGVCTYWVEHLDQARMIARCASPQLIALDGSLLGPDPQGTVDELLNASAQRVIVLGHPELRRALDVATEVVDCRLPSARLLEVLSQRLGLAARRHPRVECLVPVYAATPGSDVRGLVENVSLGGVGLVTQSALRVGDELELLFPLSRKEPVQARVRVVRVSEVQLGTSRRQRVGAEFLSLSVESSRLIEEYLRMTAQSGTTDAVMPWVPKPLGR